MPRHRTHFTAAGLRALLSTSGLEPVRAHHVLLEHNPFGMWQSLVSRVTPTPSWLYLALKRVHRSAMLVATAFVGLFVVLDLAVTWSSFAALLTLGGGYAAAANDVQRAAYVAAANYPSAVLSERE